MAVGTLNTGQAWLRYPFGLAEYGEQYPVRWQPLEGNIRVGLALPVTLPMAIVEVFSPVRSVGDWPPSWTKGDPKTAGYASKSGWQDSAEGPGPYTWAVWEPMQFRVTGDAGDVDVAAFVKAARSWWRPFIGLQVGGGGRPRGREIELAHIEAALADLDAEYEEAWLEGSAERRRVTRRDLADRLCVSESTIGRVLRESPDRAEETP